MSIASSHDRDDPVAAQSLAQHGALRWRCWRKPKPRTLRAALLMSAAMSLFTDARPAEIGLVMLRGRIGGTGAPFNIGEATVTRAAVQLASGETGFGYVLGRDREKARLAALCDALLQIDARRQPIEDHVITPLRQQQQECRALARQQTAATRVDFFTFVRGEDDR